MKKALLLIGATLATCSLAFAQMPLEVLQKSDNATLRGILDGLPEGFTYVNRTNAADDSKISSIGNPNAPGSYHTGAIELPPKAAQIIKRITFFTSAKEKDGKIFIASRPASGKFATYNLEQVNSIEVKEKALNTAEFKNPVTTEEGKVYVVGYEVKSSSSNPNGSDLLPLTFVDATKSVKEGNLVAIIPNASIITSSGEKIILEDISKNDWGNICIVVRGDNLAGATEVTDELALSVYAQEGRILIKGANNGFVVYDMTGRIVATDSNSILPTGSYIVKARFGQLEQTSKVLVK